jgi:hypothetical protein
MLALLLLAVGGQGATPANAAGLHHAGLVVRHGDGRMAYAYVSFPEDEITGIELLKRSGLDVVTISFGGLGQGVCSIDEHGCPSTDCRKRVCQGAKADDPFWQYFRQATPGEWKSVALGASTTKVRDGDLDGWSWTGTEPMLPALTLADVEREAGFTGEQVNNEATPVPGAALRREGTTVAADRQHVSGTIVAAALLFAAALVVLVIVRARSKRVAT